jgi:hypothetical protein
MADTPQTPKKSKSPKPKSSAGKAPRRPQTPPDLHDDGDLRSRVARRAYEISQSESAGSEEENWLRAERELSPQPR